MTNSAAQAVLDKMETDEAFAVRVKDAGGPEQSLAMLRDDGFDVTAEEMRDALVDRYADSLSAEQLDALAGGRDDVAIAAVVVIPIAAGVGMAAAGAAVV